jgi:hypothetical protein
MKHLEPAHHDVRVSEEEKAARRLLDRPLCAVSAAPTQRRISGSLRSRRPTSTSRPSERGWRDRDRQHPQIRGCVKEGKTFGQQDFQVFDRAAGGGAASSSRRGWSEGNSGQDKIEWGGLHAETAAQKSYCWCGSLQEAARRLSPSRCRKFCGPTRWSMSRGSVSEGPSQHRQPISRGRGSEKNSFSARRSGPSILGMGGRRDAAGPAAGPDPRLGGLVRRRAPAVRHAAIKG